MEMLNLARAVRRLLQFREGERFRHSRAVLDGYLFLWSTRKFVEFSLVSVVYNPCLSDLIPLRCQEFFRAASD